MTTYRENQCNVANITHDLGVNSKNSANVSHGPAGLINLSVNEFDGDNKISSTFNIKVET